MYCVTSHSRITNLEVTAERRGKNYPLCIHFLICSVFYELYSSNSKSIPSHLCVINSWEHKTFNVYFDVNVGVGIASCRPTSTQCAVATTVQGCVHRYTGHFLFITVLLYSEWRLQQYKSYLRSCTGNTIPSYIIHGSFKVFPESLYFWEI